jgi:outer membrane translocation and assembly module TamA
MNLGLSHGFITTPDSSETDIPFNKRFFPGGADSIRGYQEGEAAPRNADGKLIGAESYMLGNFELEQSLTRLFSVVGFVDAVGITPNFNHYPFEQTLFSAGGGLRAKTIVGPVRLEYGYNLNPRPHDPAGTIQFSFGFPF